MGKSGRDSTTTSSGPTKPGFSNRPSIRRSTKAKIQIDDILIQRSGLLPAELQELVEIFALVDEDGGGTISRNELETLMRMVGVKATRDEMDEMMNEIDKGTGEIDFESFVLTVTKKVQTNITSEQLLHAFSVLQEYDQANLPTGQITMAALTSAFTTHADHKMSLQDAKELIGQVSSQSDKDTFNYQQFMRMYNLE